MSVVLLKPKINNERGSGLLVQLVLHASNMRRGDINLDIIHGSMRVCSQLKDQFVQECIKIVSIKCFTLRLSNNSHMCTASPQTCAV